MLVFGFTNTRYSYSANAKGGLDLLQTKCSLELYNPSSVTGSTSGATYKTENGTSYFAVLTISTEYTNINYKVNNKVSNVSITLNTYTSVFDKYKRSELDKVNDYYMSQKMFNINKAKIQGLEANNPIDAKGEVIENDNNVKEDFSLYER